MDVEDNEYFVLLGAKKTLQNNFFPPILFECNNVEKNAKLFDYLKELAYNVIQLEAADNGAASNMYLAKRG